MSAAFYHSYFLCPNGGCRQCSHVIFTEVITLEELKKRYEEYPGQAYFHKHNERIRRAEENFDERQGPKT